MTEAPRRVLCVLHEHQLGGASISVLRLVDGLAERGFELSFWCPQPSPLFDELGSRGYQVRGAERTIEGFSLAALQIPPGARHRVGAAPGYFRKFDRALAELQPDLVHVNSLYAIAEGLLARRRRIPTLAHVHEMIREGRKGRLARRLLHASADEVVGVSEACADALGGAAAGVGVVHECVPVEQFGEAASARLDRGSQVATDAPLRVGSVGVISRRKGSDTFAEAAAICRARGTAASFELVGAPTVPLDRNFATELLARLPQIGVEHTAYASPIVDKLAGWDLFVLPAREDPFPIAVLEAMASGLAVVGTRVDGIAEQLANGAGILVAPDDPAAIADWVERLAADRGQLRGLGEQARERCLQLYPLERQLEGLLAAYERLPLPRALPAE